MKIVLLCWGDIYGHQTTKSHSSTPRLMMTNVDINILKLEYANKHSDTILSQELVPWITYTALWLKMSPRHK